MNRSYRRVAPRASASRTCSMPAAFREILPPRRARDEPAPGAARRAGVVRRRRRRRPRHARRPRRCSSPRRKASSWAAASARCTAPSWSACSGARCASGPRAVLLLAESGGVRLHEANAGLIAVSEVMRALLDVRAAGIPVVVLIGGANGCFGGMGIVARCADRVVMSDVGRLAMSGPEVIETSHGVEEFDSRDRALVWRTTGGKHRYLIGDCDALVDDDIAAFRAAAIAALDARRAADARGARARARAARGARSSAAATARRARHLGAPGRRRARARRRPRRRDAARAAPRPSKEPSMDWKTLLDTLFGDDHDVAARRRLAARHGATATAQTLAVIGTTDHARDRRRAGARAGARRARHGARSIRAAPILLLVDTQGQRLRHRDELLGINRYMAHLGMCIELARRRGHRVLGAGLRPGAVAAASSRRG